MNRHALLSLLALLLCCSTSLPAQKAKTYIPWKNGKLVVSEEGRYLKHENGVPFFWLGETGWLMPQRLNRDEVSYYLNKCKDAGYNMVQVQVLNGVPSMNIYGQYSMTDGFNFKDINRKGIYFISYAIPFFSGFHHLYSCAFFFEQFFYYAWKEVFAFHRFFF